MRTERKMLIAAVLVAIILFNCLLPVLQVSASTDVKITLESYLYYAVKEQLIEKGIEAAFIDEQRSFVINEAEIAKVTELSLSNYELTDLTGLEVFTNLRSLDLSSNNLTKDSNLDVLNSFDLELLDLSSNEIEDVSMITNFDEIADVNLHNQKFDIVHIIELDTSKKSDHITQVSYALPQILSKAGYLQSEWLVEETNGTPYINWSNFDHRNIKVEVGYKKGSTYVPYKDMVTLRINVSDSTNILYNSDINMFFIVVDSSERGIHMIDENMYKAVKEQLTKGQTVNSELISHKDTTPASLQRTLYERAYDEPKVLVITINDIINRIQSLDLSNKKIKRIDGIEKFVGLHKNLNLSGNYIKSIDKLIELQENQEIEEAKLRERVSEKLADLSDTVSKISAINKSIKEQEKIKEDLLKARQELEEKCAKLEEELVKLRTEKEDLEGQKTVLESEIEDLKSEIEEYNTELEAEKTSLNELEKELIDFKNAKAELEKELAALEAELAGLQADLAAERTKLEDAIANKESEIMAKIEEITRKQAEITAKQDEINAIQAEIAEKQVSIDSKRSTIAIYDVRISEINIEIVEKEEEFRLSQMEYYAINFTEPLLTTEEEVNELLAELENTNNYNNLWTDNYSESGFQANAKVAFELVNDEIASIAALITNVDATEATIRTQINELNARARSTVNNTLSGAPSELITKVEEYVNNKYSTTATTNLIETVIQLNAEFKVNAQEAVAPLVEEKDRIQAEIDKLKAEIEAADTGIEAEKAKLEEQKAALEAEKAELIEEKIALSEELAALTAELEELQNTLEHIEDTEAYKEIQFEIAIKQNEIETKKGEIAIEETRINDKEKEILDVKDRISAIEKQIQEKQKLVEEKQAEITKKEEDLKAKEEEIKAKVAEIAKIVEDLNKNSESVSATELKIAELTNNKAILETILYNQMDDLYETYNRIDKLASFAVAGLKTLTEKELEELKYEEAKSLFEQQIQKISNIEDLLTSVEKQYLIEEYGIPVSTSVTIDKTVQNEDGTTTTVQEVKTEKIENPISKYFNDLKSTTSNWDLGNYLNYLERFRKEDTYFSMITYCYLIRVFDERTTCEAYEYVDIEIENLEIDGESTDYLIDAKEEFSSVIEKYGYECSGQAHTGYLYEYAGRMVNATSDVNTYVCLPRVKSLNINENLIQNIDEISKLTELRRLYAYDNEIVDISTVNWASMEKLRVLDLGLNGISNIKPLETLKNIEELYLKANLITGSFDFDVSKFEKLSVLDLSENRIDDIEKLIQYLTYKARAYGYDDIARFLNEAEILDVRFNNQILTMKIDKKFDVNENRRVELPKIFRQIEEIDYANTSFGINSINGNVTNDGKVVLLDTTMEGNFNTSVYVVNTSVVPSLGSGTICTINYTVGQIVPVNVFITPDTAEVVIGKTQQFTATVTGENVTYTGVRWELSGATSEETTLSNGGLLTVGSDETADTVVVKATSIYDETKSAEVEVVIVKKEITSFTITPAEATVYEGESQEFTVTVEGNNLEEDDKSVKWEIFAESAEENVKPVQGTAAKVDKNVLKLTIGDGEAIEKFRIVATSNFDTTKVAEAVATVADRSVTEVLITPAEVSVEKGKTQEFEVTVNGNSLRDEDKVVTYKVVGNTSSNTKISKDGVLTVASNERATTLKVIVTSAFDNTKSAEAIVTITEAKENLKLGYEIENEYVVGVETKTPVNIFKNKLAKGYTVIVKENGNEVTTGYMKTGMYAEVQDKNGETVKDENGNLLVFEVVVTGDVNGDGLADAFDSNIIKAVRNEVGTILDVQKRAADIDNNGEIDLLDAKLLLYHRAEVKDYCLDYTE